MSMLVELGNGSGSLDALRDRRFECNLFIMPSLDCAVSPREFLTHSGRCSGLHQSPIDEGAFSPGQT
jgi:hypothetical protein